MSALRTARVIFTWAAGRRSLTGSPTLYLTLFLREHGGVGQA